MTRSRHHTREALIARLRALAASLGRKRLSCAEFGRRTGVPRSLVRRLFGGYAAFAAAAGLQPPTNQTLTTDELLRALRDDCLAAGGIVTKNYVKHHGKHSRQAYKRRWGGWPLVLAALRDWVALHDPNFPHRAALDSDGKGEGLIEALGPASFFGAPIDIPGVRYEPTNEAGVMLLFGALAHDLGFAVERVSAAFPDCEAKRRLAQGWRRTLIEFEFRSRNFQQHRHDPARCDLIVCWEHNWPEAPIEVLELKREVSIRQTTTLERVIATAARTHSQC